jgi:uncharacterized membrane protein
MRKSVLICGLLLLALPCTALAQGNRTTSPAGTAAAANPLPIRLADEPRAFAGLLTQGRDGMVLRPLRSELVFLVADDQGVLWPYNEAAEGGYATDAYVEISGVLAEPEEPMRTPRHDGVLRVTELHYLAASYSDAHLYPAAPDTAIWKLFGNEPFWGLTIYRNKLVWDAPDAGKVDYSIQTALSPYPSAAFKGTRQGGSGTLYAELRFAPGFDSMAGNWAPATARVRVGGRVYEGWAVPQVPGEPWVAVGEWRSAGQSTRGGIRLRLAADYTAELTQNVNNAAAITTGTWSVTDNGAILLSSAPQGGTTRRELALSWDGAALKVATDRRASTGGTSLEGTRFERVPDQTAQ